jgi:hypothetical protein
LAKISAQNAEREANMQRIANEGPAVPETAVEKMAREQEEFKAKNEAYRAQQMAKYRQNAMGGYTHAMGGHMYDGESTSTGFMFTPSGSSYTPNPNLLPNPWAHSGNMDLPTTDFSGAGRAPGTEGSGNYNVNTDLTNTTQDLSVKGTALQTLSGLAPIAYNTYQALKKAPTYKPEDFYTLQEAIRPDYSQAYNEAKNTYAALMKGAGQTGLSGGARAATLANAATIRNTAMGQVASAEENAYREDMARVRAANAAAKTEGNKLALQTNWAIQAAKQEHAKEALNQFKSMQESQVANDLAMKYAVMGAPDISRFINVGYTPYGQTLKEKLSPNKKKE